MPTFESFSASVLIDGKPLDEYGVETSEANGVTRVCCWIPSEAGKRYEVHFEDALCRYTSRGAVSIDGNPCGKRVINSNRPVKIKGFRISSEFIRPFIFSPLNHTDDDDALDMPCNAGQIEIRLEYVQLNGLEYRPPRPHSLPVEHIVHERAKKGIDHQTRFGREVYSRVDSRRPPYRVRPLGGDFLQFCFKYRPLDVLRANEVAPPPDIRPKAASRTPFSNIQPLGPFSEQEALVQLQTPEYIVISDDDSEEGPSMVQSRVKSEVPSTSTDLIDLTVA